MRAEPWKVFAGAKGDPVDVRRLVVQSRDFPEWIQRFMGATAAGGCSGVIDNFVWRRKRADKIVGIIQQS
jgi:hypothetical protein